MNGRGGRDRTGERMTESETEEGIIGNEQMWGEEEFHRCR